MVLQHEKAATSVVLLPIYLATAGTPLGPNYLHHIIVNILVFCILFFVAFKRCHIAVGVIVHPALVALKWRRPRLGNGKTSAISGISSTITLTSDRCHPRQ